MATVPQEGRRERKASSFPSWPLRALLFQRSIKCSHSHDVFQISLLFISCTGMWMGQISPDLSYVAEKGSNKRGRERERDCVMLLQVPAL